jgi:hypothetical protein
MVVRRVAAQCVVQILYEVVSVLIVQRHKGSAHDDKFHLITVVALFFQLLQSVSCLNIRVVSFYFIILFGGKIPGTDGSH